ncbi:MAG: PrsW family glutamic-type intramembrane protease [Ruthenibacterium sp.]
MTYIENILICLTAPLLVGALFAGTRYRRSLLLISVGYAVCLLAAYINSFFAGLYGADMATAAVEIAPVVEEVIKLLPLLFYLLIFEPEQKDVRMAIITIGASFATFENVCYLTENGASQLSYILIRGFGTGSMHIICGVIVGYGLLYVWKRPWLKLAGTLGLLCAAITYHAIYNLLVGAGGTLQTIGYCFPIATVVIALIAGKILRKRYI